MRNPTEETGRSSVSGAAVVKVHPVKMKEFLPVSHLETWSALHATARPGCLLAARGLWSAGLIRPRV